MIIIAATFPKASEVRNMKTKEQEAFEALEKATSDFINGELKDRIIKAQTEGIPACTYKERTYFPFPDFVKGDIQRTQFINLLDMNLAVLGYGVYEETDGGMVPTGTVIISWSEGAAKKTRKGI